MGRRFLVVAEETLLENRSRMVLERAVAWMEKIQPQDVKLIRVEAEATALLNEVNAAKR